MTSLNKLYIDQDGNSYWASSVKILATIVAPHLKRPKVEHMFVDGVDGKVYHVGYVIDNHWLHEYTPKREEVEV